MVSYVQRRRLRELFADFLFVQDGFLHTVVWTGSRSDKCRPFAQSDLSHFIDDQVEALVSIRGACWERRHARPPPALFLVPTAWAQWVALWLWADVF